ncbi:toxin glutamine deamidase domain-containing protein [Streptomyces sp. T21Q-yed]|uniref:toxin glutamine deamidase domain-containing protein n=1 Tax=Streptomyces sp. T21Q-yed TaxID=3018441 RepID=UPI0023DF69BF|nr:toxin glutamine deamidase domain-containing protein [Streptomyces sp. T21Q-yed]
MVTTPNNQPQQSTPQTPDSNNNGSQQNSSDNPRPKETPTPASETRNTNPPGGVTDPTRAEQDALENSVPRDENGDPTRPPDPADGRWVERINGDGRDAPGRNNNCVDVALSTVDTYAGNPTAAASRTPDLDADGNPSDRGEKGGRDRIEDTLGARFSDMGNGRDAFNRLENTLRNSGHGSQAVIITQDANGRAHAWNAVNHNGKITYIDAQTGQQSSKPLHSGNNGVFAIPLDSDRQPVSPDKPETEGSRNGERQAPETPGSAPEEPAGESLPKFDSEEVRGSAEFGERQTQDHTHENMPLEESQATLRKTHDVSQVDLGPVVENAHRWAEDGSLARVVDEVRQNKKISQDRLNEILGDNFKNLNNDQKMAVIAGIARISNSFHESHAAGNSPIDLDPERRRPKGEENEIDPRPGVSMHDNTAIPRMKPDDNNPSPASRAREYAVSHEADNNSKEARDAKHDEFDKLWKDNKNDGMRPDMSGKNYAVLEVHEKVGDEVKVHYVIDTSIPGSDRYHHDHSEPHLGEWMRTVEEKQPGRFKAVSLYTEFEPCGNRTGTGGANCSDYLSHDMERDTDDSRARTKKARENRPEEQQENPRKSDLRVSYGIGYRKGDMGNEAAAKEAEYDSPADRREAIKQGKAEDIAMRQQVKAMTDEQMVRYRGEWLRAWMKTAGSGAE